MAAEKEREWLAERLEEVTRKRFRALVAKGTAGYAKSGIGDAEEWSEELRRGLLAGRIPERFLGACEWDLARGGEERWDAICEAGRIPASRLAEAFAPLIRGADARARLAHWAKKWDFAGRSEVPRVEPGGPILCGATMGPAEAIPWETPAIREALHEAQAGLAYPTVKVANVIFGMEREEILAKHEESQAARIPIPEELVERARERSLVVLVGAGASRAGGLPGYVELAERICGGRIEEDEAAVRLDAEGWKREGGHEALREEAAKLLRREMERPGRGPSPSHMEAVRIAKEYGTGRILTTNYDGYCEAAWERTYPGMPPRVEHLHGTLHEPRGMVLTAVDLQRWWRDERRRKNLRDLLAGNAVLSIGYAWDDPDVRKIMTEATSLQEGAARKWFAIVETGMGGTYPSEGVVRIEHPLGAYGTVPILLRRIREEASRPNPRWVEEVRTLEQIAAEGPENAGREGREKIQRARGHALTVFLDAAAPARWLTREGLKVVGWTRGGERGGVELLRGPTPPPEREGEARPWRRWVAGGVSAAVLGNLYGGGSRPDTRTAEELLEAWGERREGPAHEQGRIALWLYTCARSEPALGHAVKITSRLVGEGETRPAVALLEEVLGEGQWLSLGYLGPGGGRSVPAIGAEGWSEWDLWLQYAWSEFSKAGIEARDPEALLEAVYAALGKQNRGGGAGRYDRTAFARIGEWRGEFRVPPPTAAETALEAARRAFEGLEARPESWEREIALYAQARSPGLRRVAVEAVRAARRMEPDAKLAWTLAQGRLTDEGTVVEVEKLLLDVWDEAEEGTRRRAGQVLAAAMHEGEGQERGHALSLASMIADERKRTDAVMDVIEAAGGTQPEPARGWGGPRRMSVLEPDIPIPIAPWAKGELLRDPERAYGLIMDFEERGVSGGLDGEPPYFYESRNETLGPITEACLENPDWAKGLIRALNRGRGRAGSWTFEAIFGALGRTEGPWWDTASEIDWRKAGSDPRAIEHAVGMLEGRYRATPPPDGPERKGVLALLQGTWAGLSSPRPSHARIESTDEEAAAWRLASHPGGRVAELCLRWYVKTGEESWRDIVQALREENEHGRALAAAAATRLGRRLAVRDREWLKECITSLDSEGVEGQAIRGSLEWSIQHGAGSEWAKLLKERVYGALRRPEALDGEERLARVLAVLAVRGRNPETDEGLRDQDWPIEGLRPQARSAMIEETLRLLRGEEDEALWRACLGPIRRDLSGLDRGPEAGEVQALLEYWPKAGAEEREDLLQLVERTASRGIRAGLPRGAERWDEAEWGSAHAMVRLLSRLVKASELDERGRWRQLLENAKEWVDREPDGMASGARWLDMLAEYGVPDRSTDPRSGSAARREPSA